jgi:hypothetical protein
MQEEQQIIENLHTRASKIEFQLNNQIGKLRSQLIQCLPNNQSLYKNLYANQATPRISTDNNNKIVNNYHDRSQIQF